MTRAREKLYLLSSGTPSRYLAEIDEKFVDILLDTQSQDEIFDDDNLPF